MPLFSPFDMATLKVCEMVRPFATAIVMEMPKHVAHDVHKMCSLMPECKSVFLSPNAKVMPEFKRCSCARMHVFLELVVYDVIKE